MKEKRNWNWTINRRLRKYGYQLSKYPSEAYLSELIPEINRIISVCKPEEVKQLAYLFEGMAEACRSGAKINSQLGQDAFILGLTLTLKLEKPFYLEIGAYDPVVWSNVELLRNAGKFDGFSFDPSPKTKLKFDNAALGKSFVECAVGPISGSDWFNDIDALSYVTQTPPENGQQLIKIISPLDISKIVTSADYLSLDVEGGELEILSVWPFEKLKPKMITVEHNNRDFEKESISDLLSAHGYLEFLSSVTEFESWFVLREVL